MRDHHTHRYAHSAAITAGVLALAVSLLLVIGCRSMDHGVSPADSSGGDAHRIREASAAWDEALNAADVGRLMQLYTHTPVSMPYNRPSIEGREAIEADFRELFANFNAHHKTTIVSLEILGDWAIEYGRYELTATPKAGGAPSRELGKHIVIRKKVDGQWKIHWEIWNTDEPPSTP
jgi:uncharacterized protein (TIGR02246 family)